MLFPSRRTLTASVTLAAHVWVTLAPCVVYAQDAATRQAPAPCPGPTHGH